MARYLAAHSPTERAALQTADIARRLIRGGELNQEAARPDDVRVSSASQAVREVWPADEQSMLGKKDNMRFLQGGTNMRKAAMAAVTAACFFAVTSFAALAASAFEGVWKVKDTAGHPFEITLSSGGAAKATRGEGMTGTWKEEGNSAVITWNTGWTTKITKEGNRYIKTAYGKGQSLIATPANTSDAEKAK